MSNNTTSRSQRTGGRLREIEVPNYEEPESFSDEELLENVRSPPQESIPSHAIISANHESPCPKGWENKPTIYPVRIVEQNGDYCTVSFDDDTYNLTEVPLSDVKELDEPEGEQLRVYFEFFPGERQTFAILKPDKLTPGDVVSCLCHCRDKDLRCLGRVARVNAEYCSIVFYDDTYLSGVPWKTDVWRICDWNRKEFFDAQLLDDDEMIRFKDGIWYIVDSNRLYHQRTSVSLSVALWTRP